MSETLARTRAFLAHSWPLDMLPEVEACEREVAAVLAPGPPYLDVVFDGPPGPIAGRFVEVEDARGYSVNAGEWIERAEGRSVLRIPWPDAVRLEALETLEGTAQRYVQAVYDPGADRVVAFEKLIEDLAASIATRAALSGREGEVRADSTDYQAQRG